MLERHIVFGLSVEPCLRFALLSRNDPLLLLIDRVSTNYVVDVTSGDKRNAASVLEASCLGNGLDARLVSTSPVMLLIGDPLCRMKPVSLS